MHDNVLVVVPMYNEADALGPVLDDLLAEFPHVVCIDDGSRDNSAAVARAHGARVVSHAVNLGQGAALQTGLEYARRRPQFSHVVTFDADGQHRVADAAAMTQVALESGIDVVLASRFIRPSDQAIPPSRKALLRAAVAYSRWATGLPLTDAHNGLRVLSRHAFQRLDLRQHRMAHASELQAKIRRLDLTWTEVPVTILYSERSMAKGQSNWNAVNVLFDLAVQRLRAVP